MLLNSQPGQREPGICLNLSGKVRFYWVPSKEYIKPAEDTEMSVTGYRGQMEIFKQIQAW